MRFIAIGLGLMGLYGCTSLKPSNDHVASDAGVDPSACEHKLPPGRPDIVQPDGGLDLTFAAQSLYLGTSSLDDAGRPAYLGIGWDLDNTCTGEGQGPSCLEPTWVLPSDYEDGMYGIDNALGRFFATRYPQSTDVVTLTGGRVSVLLRIRGYSGNADDDQVEASVYAVGRLTREDGATTPLWDGKDRWTILRETLSPLSDGGYSVDQPRATDPNAYVSNGILVAHFEEVFISPRLALSPDAIYRQKKMVLAGPLVQASDGTWEIHDMDWAARVQINDWLWVIGRFPSLEDPSRPVCQIEAEYQAIKREVCSYLDIASAGDSPQSPCDSLSGAGRGSAKQVKLGDVEPPAPDAVPCAPDVHPETDTCEPPQGGD